MLSLPERAGFISSHRTPTVPAPDLGHLASIVDVTGCKWPVKDDPDFVGGVAFCNHAKDENSAYCPYHRQQSVASYSRELIRKTTKSALARYKEAA